MKQLQRPPQRCARWKRVDLVLLLLVVSVVLLGLKLYAECAAGGLIDLAVPYAASSETQTGAASEKISRCEIERMPESGKTIRFLMLNAENYFVAGEKQRSRYVYHPKSESEKEAVAEVISSVKPDIVGLIEMGGPLALSDLQQRLAARGLFYEHSRVLLRGGEERALALLSVFPIARDESKADYGLYGQLKRRMLRGILDVTLRSADGRFFRVLGIHLKSRLGEDFALSASLREREAQTLAHYIHLKMKDYPTLPMVVFGDLNDNPHDASVRMLEQGASAEAALHRLKPKDSRGEEWTLYHRRGNTYHVFDYIFVNKPMKQRMQRNPVSGVVDIPSARTASDHRAVWCELR